MTSATTACARCTTANHAASRFCTGCGLPLGAAEADAGAWVDLLGPEEAAEFADPDVARLIREFVARSGHEYHPTGSGWRVDVPLPLGRKQAVFVAEAGADPDGRPIVALSSISGTANERDPRALLKLNARALDGHFAIRVLRGEEYFVVARNLEADAVADLDARTLLSRIAAAADALEDRLTRGRDLF